ncbi:hypothetical protein BDY21DRAFT_366549 [Lineolata rhizophorae]|uniref:FAD-binding domain-containing protein n=1 Tax=Lineolata rhizophorae TaxID=578093 RepID=A0A6A6NQY7_9PEZI|nr:hypothetical protein BDY21DRAFT_366549 [Lineolata rhizophorae]
MAKQGVRVTMLDMASAVDDRPRAAHYAPCAIRELRRAGALDAVRAQGVVPGAMCWRKRHPDWEVAVKVDDFVQRSNPDMMTVLPLGQLGQVLMAEGQKEKNIEFRFGHEVVSVGQDDGGAWATCKLSDGGETVVRGDYLCGCDGANSIVRRTLFGERFDGFTWDAQIIATNVYYPLDKMGFEDINFIIDPEDYYMAARITQDGMWRVSYGEDPSFDKEAVLKNQPIKYERMLPGHPKPGDYKITNVGPYRIHQRCAEKMRVGRIAIAADAAHLCNPFGGMGLTGGLVDAGGLADCLIGIAKGWADPEEILDLYCKKRREMYHTVINPVSSDNFRRVSSKDPDKTAKEDEVINMYRQAGVDPEMKKIVDGFMYGPCYDFTQHYNKNASAKI